MSLSINSNLQYNIIMLNWISSLRVLDKKYFWMCGANNFDLFRKTNGIDNTNISSGT